MPDIQSYDDYDIHRCEDDLFMNLFADRETIKNACRDNFYFLNDHELEDTIKKIKKESKRF